MFKAVVRFCLFESILIVETIEKMYIKPWHCAMTNYCESLLSSNSLQAFPAAGLLKELRAESALFIRAGLGQSCLDACTDFGCASERILAPYDFPTIVNKIPIYIRSPFDNTSYNTFDTSFEAHS